MSTDTTINTEERQAIEQAIQTYFDGLYEGDADKLASVFHDTSALTWEQDGQLAVWTLAEWLKAVRERPSPKAKGLARDDAILWLDQSGPNTAFVKVRCQLPPRYFTDYLVAMKLSDGWKIVSKSYRYDLRG